MTDIAKLKKDVEDILSSSDIVWPKYGSDSKTELADRIVTKICQEEMANRIITKILGERA